MGVPLVAPLPDDLDLGGSWVVEWDAVDPVTGASVSGVVISEANIVGTDSSSAPPPQDGKLGPFQLVAGADA